MENKSVQNLGFNWGAFFITPIWCFSFGKTWLGIVSSTLAFYINRGEFAEYSWVLLIVNLAISFYVGNNGYKTAWKSGNYETVDIMILRQKKWAVAGFFIAAIYLIVTISFISGNGNVVESYYN